MGELHQSVSETSGQNPNTATQTCPESQQNEEAGAGCKAQSGNISSITALSSHAILFRSVVVLQLIVIILQMSAVISSVFIYTISYVCVVDMLRY